MSIEPDPYRILGLNRGASADDVRRAYRRLVKENHPDSAGEKALPRFLAIQAAYEALTGGPSSRQLGGRPAAARPRSPWRAEPDRARSTQDPSRRPGSSGAGAASGSAGGRSGGPDGPGAGSTGTSGSTGAPGGRGSRPRPRPAGSRGSTGPGASRPAGGTNRAPGDRPRREGRKRAPNKATLGSTSYDAAEEEPFEPEWSGGTWYGASSGTYWTINPKEYADPRKHGPEYQARARRRTTGTGVGGSARATDGPWDADAAEPAEPRFSGSADDFAPASDEAAQDEPARGRPRSTWSTPIWDAAAPSDAPSPERSDGLDPFSAAAKVAMNLAGTPRGFTARVGLALLGWPAIGLVLTTAAGEVTGCGRFAASCVDLFGVGTWLGQLIIIAILLALPSVAALSAVGSLAALAASVPTAVILSASGGSNEPAASATILGGVLVVAYTAGVLIALVRRRRIVPLP